MPTPEQLQAYADGLPDIYRDILHVFGSQPVERRYREPVIEGSIVATLGGWQGHRRPKYPPAQVEAALDKFETAGILEWSGALWDIPLDSPRPQPGDRSQARGRYAPTDLGEQLIAVVTGRPALKVEVPELPAPTW